MEPMFCVEFNSHVMADFQTYVDTGFNQRDDIGPDKNGRSSSAEDFTSQTGPNSANALESTALIPISRLSSQDLNMALGGLDCVNYIVNRTKQDVLNQSVNMFIQ